MKFGLVIVALAYTTVACGTFEELSWLHRDLQALADALPAVQVPKHARKTTKGLPEELLEERTLQSFNTLQISEIRREVEYRLRMLLHLVARGTTDIEDALEIEEMVEGLDSLKNNDHTGKLKILWKQLKNLLSQFKNKNENEKRELYFRFMLDYFYERFVRQNAEVLKEIQARKLTSRELQAYAILAGQLGDLLPKEKEVAGKVEAIQKALRGLRSKV